MVYKVKFNFGLSVGWAKWPCKGQKGSLRLKAKFISKIAVWTKGSKWRL